MKRYAFILLVYSISAFGMHSGSEDGSSEMANCTEDERALFYDDTFAKCWVDCTSLFGLDTDRMATSYPGLSESCMRCVVEMTDCGIENCKRKCAPWPIGHGASSQKCKECSRNHCGKAFDACIGKADGARTDPPTEL